MLIRAACAAVAGLLSALLVLSAAMAVTPEEQKAKCEEAAQRYQELHGRPAAAEQPPVVLMYKHTFCPLHLTVKRGTEVRFLNVDRRTSHSFWFKDAGRPESERFFPGEGATMTLDLEPGEHTYLCGPHWEQEKMIGRITITP
jgi:plastocyanin